MTKHNFFKKTFAFAFSMAISAGSCLSAFAAEESDVKSNNELYSPIILAVKTRVDEGFFNYPEDKIESSGIIIDNTQGYSGIWYMPFAEITADKTGYAIADINGDGIDELAVGGVDEEGNGTIYDLYTQHNGEVFHIASAGERDRFSAVRGNTIVEAGSNGAEKSWISFLDIAETQFKYIAAYKIEGDKVYKLQVAPPYENINDHEAGIWSVTDENPMDFSYQPIKFTPFSEIKEETPNADTLVLLKANIAGQGQISYTDDGSEPVFDDEYPVQSIGCNLTKGSKVKLSAKADEGYKFLFWMNEDTNDIYSKEPNISIEIDEALSLKAVFDLDVERVLMKVNIYGCGQIAENEESGEPEFDEEYPYQSIVKNVIKGNTVAFKAKADDDWHFKEWYEKNSCRTYSTDEMIIVEADEEIDLVAVFESDDTTYTDSHIAGDFEFIKWAVNDYKGKTGIKADAEISSSGDEYEISLLDSDDERLDTYTIDPITGIGTNESGEIVNLPQTGTSGIPNSLIAGFAFVMSAVGFGFVCKSRKDDDK